METGGAVQDAQAIQCIAHVIATSAGSQNGFDVLVGLDV